MRAHTAQWARAKANAHTHTLTFPRYLLINVYFHRKHSTGANSNTKKSEFTRVWKDENEYETNGGKASIIHTRGSMHIWYENVYFRFSIALSLRSNWNRGSMRGREKESERESEKKNVKNVIFGC